MYTALSDSQTIGPEFHVPAAVDYDCLVTGFVSGMIQIEIKQGSLWQAMDCEGRDTATWTSSCGGLVPLNPYRTYRVRATVSGATMTIVAQAGRDTGYPDLFPFDAPGE